jgi:hypothetical protein
MELVDWDRVKAVTLKTANKYSITLAAFHSVERKPRLATGTIVQSKAGACLLTAGHVLRHLLELEDHGRLQIGRDQSVLDHVSPASMTIGRAVDIGCLRLSGSQVAQLALPVLPWDDVSREKVQQGVLVAFIGYPGCWKRERPDGVVGIGSYEFFGFVQTVENDQFSVRVDDTHEVFVRTTRDDQSPLETDVGGLSGAPIFQAADRPKLVGIVSEGAAWSLSAQKIFAVHVETLDHKGQIRA